MDLEQMIPEPYSNFIHKIHIPYWFIGNKLYKIFINEYIDVIKYIEILKDVIQKSNVIKIKYENINTYNDILVLNNDLFLENLRIFYNQEYIKLTTIYNTSMVFTKSHLNIYKDDNYKSYCNIHFIKFFYF